MSRHSEFQKILFDLPWYRAQGMSQRKIVLGVETKLFCSNTTNTRREILEIIRKITFSHTVLKLVENELLHSNPTFIFDRWIYLSTVCLLNLV